MQSLCVLILFQNASIFVSLRVVAVVVVDEVVVNLPAPRSRPFTVEQQQRSVVFLFNISLSTLSLVNTRRHFGFCCGTTWRLISPEVYATPG